MQDNHAVLGTLREATARIRNREGVAMVVALVDERHPLPVSADPIVRREGSALAARVQEIHRSVAPTMREDDNGGVISALMIAAQEHAAGGSGG